MAVDDPKTIDIISIAPTGEVHLTVSDHLEWERNPEHLSILQDKLNIYLAFIESGEIVEKYPEAKDRPVVIEVVFFHEPDASAVEFLRKAGETIVGAGFKFKYWIFRTSAQMDS